MTDKQRTNSFGPRMNRRTFVGQRGRRGRRRRAGRRPAREPGAGGDHERPSRSTCPRSSTWSSRCRRTAASTTTSAPSPARGDSTTRTAIRLPTGRSVFQQPDPANPDGYLEPWHMSTITTGAAAGPFAVPRLARPARLLEPGRDGRLAAHPPRLRRRRQRLVHHGLLHRGRHPLPLGARQGVHAGGQLPLLGHGPDRPEPALLGRGRQRPAGQGRRAGPRDRRRARPDLRKRRTRPSTTPGISYKFYQNSGWPQSTITAPTSSSSRPPGWCPRPSTTP